MKHLPGQFHFIPRTLLDERERQLLTEEKLIGDDVPVHLQHSGILLRDDHRLCVCINEGDHIRIRAVSRSDDMDEVYRLALDTAKALEKHLLFAFDRQWGYLTPSPAASGTALHCEMLLHLPFTALMNKTGELVSFASRAALSLRPYHPEQKDNPGSLYLLDNKVTLGCSEEELTGTLKDIAVRARLTESASCMAYLSAHHIEFEDHVARAAALLQNALLMTEEEYHRLWSTIRAGIYSGILHTELEKWNLALYIGTEDHVSAGENIINDKQQTQKMICLGIRQYLKKENITWQ